MAEQLSPETEQRIEQLVREIAGTHKLDDELRRELQGHIEDKLLGYMRGEETVTEADAFVLAREHFGDEQNLRELLGTSMPESHLFRRVLALVIVAYAWGVGFSLASPRLLAPGTLAYLFGVALPFLFMIVGWLLLLRWRSAERHGYKLWFQRWKLRTLLLSCLLLLAALIPSVSFLALRLVDAHDGPHHLVLLVSRLLCVVLYGALCVWWCDAAYGGWRHAYRAVFLFSLGSAAFGVGILLSLLLLFLVVSISIFDFSIASGYLIMLPVFMFGIVINWLVAFLLLLLGAALCRLTFARLQGSEARSVEVAHD